jgi:integrase
VSAPSQRNPTGSRTWVIEYRPGGGGRNTPKRRFKIGTFEALSPDEARSIAREHLARILVDHADPAAKRSADRKRSALSDLREAYFATTDPYRKPRTRTMYAWLWSKYIEPELGSMRVDLIARSHVERMHRKIGERHAATANRVAMLLGNFFRWCQANGHCDPQHNPAVIKRFREQGRERYLTSEEFRRLGAAIAQAETTGIRWVADPAKKSKHAPKLPENQLVKLGAHPAAALRLLILTGARLREILELEWGHVDLERGVLTLPDSKSGRKHILLSGPAIEILSALHAARSRVDGARYVIEGADPSKPRADLQRPWAMIRRAAGIPDVRLHDLRHSYASVGAALNLGLPVIGSLLGHSDPQTTRRYAHLSDTPLRAASNHIAREILGLLGHVA